MINAFSRNLNTVNRQLKIKLWPFYEIMKDFALKVLIVKRSQKLYRVQFPLPDFVDSDLGYWYIIRKVNIKNRGMNLKNTLCTNALEALGLGFRAKLVAWGKWID